MKILLMILILFFVSCKTLLINDRTVEHIDSVSVKTYVRDSFTKDTVRYTKNYTKFSSNPPQLLGKWYQIAGLAIVALLIVLILKK
jgi:hypothetical protein